MRHSIFGVGANCRGSHTHRLGRVGGSTRHPAFDLEAEGSTRSFTHWLGLGISHLAGPNSQGACRTPLGGAPSEAAEVRRVERDAARTHSGSSMWQGGRRHCLLRVGGENADGNADAASANHSRHSRAMATMVEAGFSGRPVAGGGREAAAAAAAWHAAMCMDPRLCSSKSAAAGDGRVAR